MPSSILAWRIPWTEEPTEPQSMGVTNRWKQQSMNSEHTKKTVEAENGVSN